MSAPGWRLHDAEMRRLAAAVPDLSQPGLDPVDVETFQDSPLCGDQVHLQAQLREGRIQCLSARAEGCVLCLAATRMVALLAQGQVPAIAGDALAALETLWQTSQASAAWPDLAVFEPLRAHRNRRHCVRLPFVAWATLAASAEAPP